MPDRTCISPFLLGLVALATAPLACVNDGASDAGVSGASALAAAGLAITTPLSLASSVIARGTTLTASVTYTNQSASPIAIDDVVIAARPPGGTHAGGPFDDLGPTAGAATVQPGASLTVSASRAFTTSDPLGTWTLYATFQDDGGAWHDGPESSLDVAPSCGDPGGAAPTDAGSSSGPPLVQAPIAGATAGSWQAQTLNGFPYQLLMPAEYDASKAYPLVLFLHQLDNASQMPAQIDPWFNDVAFRTNHPAIVVAPQCFMDADPSGNTINWGGVSSGDQPCQDAAIAIVDAMIATYSVYAPKIYVTGDSMGGIGSWDAILKFNTKQPTVRPIFAAALILAGATYDWGYPTPNADVVSRLHDVPIWAIHGGQDTQVPLEWDENLFAAEQAQGGLMKLLVDPNLGHDVWDTYYVEPTSETYWAWLFTQSK